MKHVGKMKNNSARVVVVYRTLPGDPHNCLVVGTQGLVDSYHDTLMNLVEHESAQQANELADILAVRKFPDGSNMLGFLHNRDHLKKVPTNMVLMTPSSQVSIPLNELNQLIAEQKGVSVDQLAVSDEQAPARPQTATSEEKVEGKTELTPAEMRSKADALYKQAAILRKQADLLDPPKKKKTADSKEASAVDFE